MRVEEKVAEQEHEGWIRALREGEADQGVLGSDFRLDYDKEDNFFVPSLERALGSVVTSQA